MQKPKKKLDRFFGGIFLMFQTARKSSEQGAVNRRYLYQSQRSDKTGGNSIKSALEGRYGGRKKPCYNTGMDIKSIPKIPEDQITPIMAELLELIQLQREEIYLL